jgi:hypothetical protein
VPDPPDILKYFHEEPALLEPLTPDADPDARRREDRSDLPDGVSVPLEDLLDTRDVYRGYLAGTNHADDEVGLTTLRSPGAYVPPLREALGRSWWARCTDSGTVEALDERAVRRVLCGPTNTTLLATADAPVGTERITAVAAATGASSPPPRCGTGSYRPSAGTRPPRPAGSFFPTRKHDLSPSSTSTNGS